MGYIKEEVLNNINLSREDLEIAKCFTTGFIVNYGDVVNKVNTMITVFILEPEDFMREGFGLEKEILLAISHYDQMEARTVNAAEKIFMEYPFKNRVDNLCYFLVSHDTGVEKWLNLYYDGSINSRIVIPYSIDELLSSKSDQWFIRERLRKYSFDKDLFDYTLPLQSDNSFFGRQQILGRYIDSIRRCQNRGIFGLRKTGKTSLLFKIMRTVKEQGLGQVFFYDCKKPQVRKKRWYELLYDINMSIAGRLGMKKFTSQTGEIQCVSSFNYLMRRAADRGIKIILIFDEIEYISYFAKQDKHWKDDYFDFWQTLWSEQSTFANLCFIICGVNAYVTEKDSIDGIQNPLFGIIQSEYLKGLSKDEVSAMVKTLGKRMGLRFNHEAIDFLYQQYGGHPMLTRLACSWLNRSFSGESRPITFTKEKIEEFQTDIDTDPTFYSYFGHIVSEIKQFYPDEYEMLELLSTGQTDDFIELSATSEFVQHLKSYGLIDKKNNVPVISLPVAGKYIAIEQAKREGRRTAYRLVPKERRMSWVSHRVDIIIDTIRAMESSIRQADRPSLYGINSFSEAEKLKCVPEVVDRATFSNFINIFYRCFVESCKNYGRSLGNQNYLEVVKSCYPALYRTFDKISEYRNEQDHILLTDYHKKILDEYLKEDLENLDAEQEKLFCLQQKLIIEMIISIYSETMNLE